MGTTLRSYLSDMLWCDPMRITKKFAGASCIGKQVFSKNDDITQKDREIAEQELNALKDAFREYIICISVLVIMMTKSNSGLPGNRN